MDKTALVDTDIEDGKRIIGSLDDAEFPVSDALWSYLPDNNEWRLMIASPRVDTRGPRQAYEEVQSVLTGLSPAVRTALSDVSLVGTNDSLVRLLRRVIATGPGISGIRFTRNTIAGVFIEDAFIYRLSAAVAP